MSLKNFGQCWMVGDNTLWALTVTAAVPWILMSCRRLLRLWVSYEISFWLGIETCCQTILWQPYLIMAWMDCTPLSITGTQLWPTNQTALLFLMNSFYPPSILGFRFSPQTINAIAKRYSSRGKITFDDYIACCVKIRALTGMFDHGFIIGVGR